MSNFGTSPGAGRVRLLSAALAAICALSGCKFESGGGGSSTPPIPPTMPTSSSSIAPAPQLSSVGTLTLQQYAPTTAEAGGISTTSRYTLTHEETVP